jgi:hypothetical protein
MRMFCGSKHPRAKLEQRFRELAPKLLGIVNTNDEVVPVGAMLNMLQGGSSTTRAGNGRARESVLGA